MATQLIAGLYNSEHQAKVLSESANLPSMIDKLQRLLVLEKSDASLSSLNASDPVSGSATSNFTKGNYTKKDKFDKSQKKWSQKQSGVPAIPKTQNGVQKNDKSENCDECGKKHPQCRACQGYHKCTTRCNTCKGMGHIRNCCPTSANVSVTAPSGDHTTLEEEGVVCFCVTGEEQELMVGTNDILPQLVESQVRIGDNASAMDDFENFDELPAPTSSVETVSLLVPSTVGTVTLLPANDLAGDVDLCSTKDADSFSSMTMEPLLHMECVNKEFRRTKPKNAPMMNITCKLLVEVHARYRKFLSGKRGKRVNRNTITASGLADTGAQI